jgi:hypothetical protein
MSNLNSKKKGNEVISLNEHFYDEFFVQELESRLETDPLLVGGLVDFLNPNDGTLALQSPDCPELQTCGCYCNSY